MKENEEEIPDIEESELLEELVIIDGEEEVDIDEEMDDFYKDPFLYDDEFDDPTNENVYRVICGDCLGINSEDCLGDCNGTGYVPGERFGGLDIDETFVDD